MTPTETPRSVDPSSPAQRRGGFIPALLGFLFGAIVGWSVAVYSVDIVMRFTPLTVQELIEVNSLPARIAAVVAVAGLLGFIGLLLDVLYSGERPVVDLAVRMIALAAGTTAFVGAWVALPSALNAALSFLVIAGLFVIVVATFIVGGVVRARRSHWQ